ncbi:MAG TPA: hypothetical protein VLK33_06765 [Terriglobales bacterium]|nr:hypothetical protein [Terriglobales bacterium]
MDKLKKHLWKEIAALVFILLIAASLAWAQSQPPLKSADTDPDATHPSEATHQISPKEADELFHSVDDILKFCSKDTGLPIKHSVNRKLTSRDEVEEFLRKGMADDKDAERFRRSELVLKKFGLLPRDFEMQKFLIALLREQVAGYYDPKTKYVNLLNWIDPEQQRPVLAHELTHALQDQSFGLKKWMVFEDPADRKNPGAEDIQNDEISTARQAVVEGQATAVLIDYMLAPAGQSIQTSPQIAEALKAGMLVGSADSVQLHNAPNFIREALTFPYRYGLDFEVALLTKAGKEKAYQDTFKNPPTSTRQIMEPETYLSGERIPPMFVPNFKQIFKNYNRFDIGSIGEFDVAMLIDQYAGAEAPQKLYTHWRGGYYYAAKAKNDASAPLGLFYISRWSDQEHAAKFASIYARSLWKRYKQVHGVAEGNIQPLDSVAAITDLDGRHVWSTEEGPVVIEVRQDTLLITESLDEPTTESLERTFLTSKTH